MMTGGQGCPNYVRLYSHPLATATGPDPSLTAHSDVSLRTAKCHIRIVLA